MLLQHNLVTEVSTRWDICHNWEEENWKLHVDEAENTDVAYVYEHEQAIIKCYKLDHP